ncbi:MAG: LysM peptidoglycan-binding domain-containing protein, partial [Acidimicrobiales bacterium]|nr:LysM peptidoglycan-binding domain-containing protein [Acidimicrobiales bacterium]
MTNRRLPSFVRGLGALLATAVLLVGVPVGLAVLVGWPLPTSIPSGDALTGALNTGITDTFIVNAIAVIAWLAWAQLTVAFAAEAITAVRGRPSLRLPVAPGFQVAASRLVAGILMLAAPLQPARAAAAEAPTPVVATITETPQTVVQSVRTPMPTPETEAAVTTPARPVRETRTVTVERHDTYWEIAERELGDGLRWHEIQTRNVGRTMPDGHVIATGDDTLRAGWTLDIATTDAQATAGGEIEVQAGDNLWTLSETQLATDLGRPATDHEVAPYWTDVIDANHDRLTDPTNPSLIHPGQTIAMPPTRHAAPPAVVDPVTPEPVVEEAQPEAAESPPEEPATPSPSTTVVSEEADPEPAAAAAPVTADSDLDHADDGTPLPLIAVAGGLTSVALAVGAKRLIERRRREHLLDHDMLPEPQPEQRQLHQTIVAMADEDLIGHLNYALGELAVTFADTGIASRPRVVRHSPDSLEILLTDPAPIDIPGWRSDGDGRVLTLDHTINLDIDLDGPRCAAPLMVTIGQREEGANLYLDLEAEGIVALVGVVESARQLARSILTELTISPLADHNRVITIGDLVEPTAEALPRLTRLETWQDLADDLHTWLTASHRALDLNTWPNAFVGRG